MTDPLIARIVGFLEEIGLPCRAERIEAETVLPGIRTVAGTLTHDPDALTNPGDLLHEAGHLALLLPVQRATAGDNMGTDGGFEMGAMAWSWAALTHLGLDPASVFHEDGYRGEAQALIAGFQTGRSIGVPMLEWRGLTDDFPRMQRWLAE